MTVPIEGFKLSVLLVTYNHEQYIGRALESLFKQDYAGPIELVIADDASTDGTLNRIREYEGKDSRFSFKYLPGEANLGITRNYRRGFAACSGQYVAVLEGDDYWITPGKLSRQVQFLADHWECDLCSANYFVFHEDTSAFFERAEIGMGHRLLSVRDLIADNLVGNFSTCLYRKTALEALPAELFETRSYDWIVNICIARNCLIGFIEEPMSVYRVHSASAWSNHEHVEKLKLQLSLIPTYDAITNRQFHAEFTQLEHNLRKKINLARVSHLTGGVAGPLAKWLARLHDCMPPIVTMLIRALLPPVLTRQLRKGVLRGQDMP